MKTLKKLFVIVLVFSILSCSDDDANNPTNGLKANITINAKKTFNQTAGRSVLANGLEIEEFFINIRKIEFEYAEDSESEGDLTSDHDDDDINLTFEELPQQIKDYLSVNHSDDPFCKAEEEDSNDPYKYEVELISGLELYFRADFTLYAQEQDDEPCDDDDSTNDGSSAYGVDDEVLLAGPFEINLSDDEITTIVNVDIPIGTYEEVEFKMDVSDNMSSPLYQKSIMITGTLNGTPMTFFHTFEEDFELDYEDSGLNLVIDDGNSNEITFNFDLNAVVNAVDISSATDGNSDGTIEISPNDTDGNNALANQIKSAIVQYAELID